jgi:hypothetical protein
VKGYRESSVGYWQRTLAAQAAINKFGLALASNPNEDIYPAEAAINF